MARRECPRPEEDCLQDEIVKELEENVQGLAHECSEVLDKLPSLQTDLGSLEDKISLYSKVALAFVTILCGIATYGFFEINDFRKEYQQAVITEQRTKQQFQHEIRKDLYNLERKIYDRDERILEKLASVEKSVARLAAVHDNSIHNSSNKGN